MRCRGLHRLAIPAYLSGFLCSALLRVAPYCVRGGIRLVSNAPLIGSPRRGPLDRVFSYTLQERDRHKTTPFQTVFDEPSRLGASDTPTATTALHQERHDKHPQVQENHGFGTEPILSAGRDPRPKASTLSWLARYFQSPAQAHGSLTHRLQAEVSREGPRRIEAHTIVAYPERDSVGATLQVQFHTARPSMLDGVMQRLLGDAVERLLRFQRHVGLLAADGRSDRDFVPGAQRRRLLLQRDDQALVLK